MASGLRIRPPSRSRRKARSATDPENPLLRIEPCSTSIEKLERSYAPVGRVQHNGIRLDRHVVASGFSGDIHPIVRGHCESLRGRRNSIQGVRRGFAWDRRVPLGSQQPRSRPPVQGRRREPRVGRVDIERGATGPRVAGALRGARSRAGREPAPPALASARRGARSPTLSQRAIHLLGCAPNE